MQSSSEPSVTVLLEQFSSGSPRALEELIPLVYGELKMIARRVFAKENAGHTLQPTALINEAFERMSGSSVSWQNRNHFFACCAQLMRRILVDHARSKLADKRGNKGVHTQFKDDIPSEIQLDDILILDSCMEKLSLADERKAKVLELTYFGGMTYEEIAAHLNVSSKTVARDFRFAKAWINRAIA